ncbi:hypothetical protein [Celeribacter neptunius]|uniref:Uncharacterized protein n=1 Tax=Celeribacter neptunius TaxID=588602 RepID=A0A1I3JPK3_9RHOB|nr:hypothetical protein [Celeribacter neptunius]SFI62187.1 hypothetical protein SAMN04487991_0422 [Celeribacter neptunius]
MAPITLSFVYLILCFQLYLGLPPFYGKSALLRPRGLLLHEGPPVPGKAFVAVGAIFALLLLFALTRIPLLPWLALPLAFLGGQTLRRALIREGRDRTLVLLNGLSVPYPLWLFDLWSLGLAVGATLIIHA